MLPSRRRSISAHRAIATTPQQLFVDEVNVRASIAWRMPITTLLFQATTFTLPTAWTLWASRHPSCSVVRTTIRTTHFSITHLSNVNSSAHTKDVSWTSAIKVRFTNVFRFRRMNLVGWCAVNSVWPVWSSTVIEKFAVSLTTGNCLPMVLDFKYWRDKAIIIYYYLSDPTTTTATPDRK